MLRGVKGFLKDILFPIFCVECGREGEWWCESCLSLLSLKPILACPLCGRNTPEGAVCEACHKMSMLNGETALFTYDARSPIGQLLKQFKYGYASDLSALWGQLWKKFLEISARPAWLEGAELTIMPVPLHPRRERERGFNQAEILARLFFQTTHHYQTTHYYWNGCRYENSLKRVRYTRQQVRLTGEERRKNLYDVFSWPKQEAPPAKVLLVDDVFTTGTTMQECARVLKQKGAQSVWGLTLARG